jgi:ankyrin repeat protein
MELLKTRKVDVDLKDPRGWTPLLLASENEDDSIVRQLFLTDINLRTSVLVAGQRLY